MKKSKRLLTMFLVGAMAISTLTGCGGGATSGKKEIELFSTKAENKDMLQKLVDKYQGANPDVKITITAPQDAGTVLKTRLTKDDIPDVIAMGGDATYKELQSAGVLEDLSAEPYISDLQESYVQMVYDVNKDKEEKVYGVPYATNASGILYNEDMFAEVGVSVPTTWDELLDVIVKLEAAGKTPFELTFKDAWTCLPPWNSMAPDLQPANFTDDKLVNKTTFSDTHVEIATKYLELLKHAQPDYMGTTYNDGNKTFAEGNAAMMINGNWAISEFIKTNPDFKVNIFAFPASNDSSVNYVTSGVDVLFAVSESSKVKDEAKGFITFMLEEENAQAYIDDQFAFSAVKGVEQSNPTVAGIKEDIANGKVANFPDHYYPSGFDLASILSEFALNASSGMDEKENITNFLKTVDEKYDTANVN